MKYATTFIALIICFGSYAQSEKGMAAYHKNAAICGGIDSILARKGKWKRVEDAYAFPDKTLAKNQYKFVSSRIDSIFSVYKEAITDMRGYEPKWYRGMRGDSYTKDGPVPYTFQAYYLEYYCNDNLDKIILGDETYTWHHVFVNHYNWFCNRIGDWDYKGDGKKIMIFLLPPKVGTWKGRTLYAPTILANCRAVVLGHNGKLPWRSLTRKEYLLGLKSNDKEVYQKYHSPSVLEQIDRIDAYLATTPEETLNEPAVVNPKNGISFNGKWADEENGGSRVVVFSSSYWNKDLPRWAPQFMILFWRFEESPILMAVKNQLEENFPLEKLKALMDK